MRTSNERGIALITVLLVMMLMSALLVGFTAVVMSDQRYRFIDRDRGQAFYAANAGVEKLTSDLGNLFFANVAPTAAQVNALTAAGTAPTIDNVTFTGAIAPPVVPQSSLSNCTSTTPPGVVQVSGTTGYTISFCASTSTGNPTAAETRAITKGPYEGLLALQTPYQVDVTARTTTGGDVHLVRTIESVAIPVFQFGMFSDVDLSFSAADDFNFGGRVHTNGNLYLAETGSRTLTMSDRVTAVGEVVRQRLSNGVSIDTVGQTGTVKVAKAAGLLRTLARTEGSVTDGPTSSQNEPTWHNVSLSSYNSWLRNGRTGAKTLSLPLITVGGTNPDLVRRPAVNEDTVKPILYGERLYTKASLRILLSDKKTDITSLPGVSSLDPVFLGGDWSTTPPSNGGGVPYNSVSKDNPPIARSPGALSATTNSGSTSSTITVADTIPFRPAMFLNGSPVTCTAKTSSQFTGCTVATAQPSGVALTSGGGISANTTTGTSAGASVSITVGSGNTDAFRPQPFWYNDDLVTCTGWDATPRFTGCAGSSAPSSGKPLRSNALSSAGTDLIGGWLKVERQNTDGTWADVTMEILNYGIGGTNIDGTGCGTISPNAIIRLQRLRDNGGGTPTTSGGGCNYNTDATGAKDATNWWPNALFDAREAVQRDDNYPGTNNIVLGGVMYYVAIDAANLSRWFMHTGAYSSGSGNLSITDNGGYTVYFSDRRNNRNAAGEETGEFGWEDFVNPGVTNGAPNGSLDAGEDVNGDGTLDTYGGVPNYNGVYNSAPPGSASPLNTSADPTTIISRGQAEVNRAILFRRALKLTNGATLSATGITGLTIVSENPLYIDGNWNANGTFSGSHAATSVIADAVTVLSGNWSDNKSFAFPYANGSRPRASDSWYRVAIIGGKGPIFPKPSDVSGGSTFGTDGGAHSFLRMLEGTSGTTVHYRGSMATFFYNRQAVGPFKCCGGVVYTPPERDYVFDTDFQDPALLPPNTPVFRDMNAVGFAQELRPGR